MKFLVLLFIAINLLRAGEIVNYKDINTLQKNFFVLEKIEGDLTNNGLNDIVLILASEQERSSSKTKQKRELIVLKNLGNKKYELVIRNNNAIPIKNISSDGLDNHHEVLIKNGFLVIGIVYDKAEAISYFYFSMHNKKLVDYEFVDFQCLHEIEENYKIKKDDIFDLSIDDFSADNVYTAQYKIPSKKDLVKSTNNFANEYKTFLSFYKAKNLHKLQQALNEYVTKDFKIEETCNISEYMNKYLFLNNTKNIAMTNDIAFFLEQTQYYDESIYLLEKILEKFPNRTVAYLNLGDAYWGLGDTEKAKAAYQTYIKQMKESGKEEKIPKVVLERVK